MFHRHTIFPNANLFILGQKDTTFDSNPTHKERNAMECEQPEKTGRRCESQHMIHNYLFLLKHCKFNWYHSNWLSSKAHGQIFEPSSLGIAGPASTADTSRYQYTNVTENFWVPPPEKVNNVTTYSYPRPYEEI